LHLFGDDLVVHFHFPWVRLRAPGGASRGYGGSL
jgi:hypothetical protein